MTKLTINGSVEHAKALEIADLRQIPESNQIANAQEVGAKRPGRAVRLRAVLDLCKPQPDADYIGLHATRDDFHASVPLAPLLDQAILIYEQNGQPLPSSAGGPYRLFIPNHSECHVSEIDECANVKFVDQIELTVGKGFDNRPQDDAEHQALHAQEEDHDHDHDH